MKALPNPLIGGREALEVDEVMMNRCCILQKPIAYGGEDFEELRRWSKW